APSQCVSGSTRSSARADANRTKCTGETPTGRDDKVTTMQRTITPVDGSVYVERELATDSAGENALARAVEAQKSWKKITLAERIEICRRMVAWCVTRADELRAAARSVRRRSAGPSARRARRG